MKKIVVLIFLVSLVLSGCSILNSKGEEASIKALKSLGVVYSTGDYSMKGATCSGFITADQTVIFLSIPVAKHFYLGETVNVKTIENVELRVNGFYVNNYQSNLTQYIKSAQIKNDGAILFVKLENPNKWNTSDKKVIPNNISFTGTVDISFSVVEP